MIHNEMERVADAIPAAELWGQEGLCWARQRGIKKIGRGRSHFDDNPESPHRTHDRLARQRPTFGLCRPAAGSLVSRVPSCPPCAALRRQDDLVCSVLFTLTRLPSRALRISSSTLSPGGPS